MVDEKSVFKALVNNEKGIFQSLNDLTDLGKRFFVCSVHLFLQEDISKNRKCLQTFEFIEKQKTLKVSKQKCLSILSDFVNINTFLTNQNSKKQINNWIQPKENEVLNSPTREKMASLKKCLLWQKRLVKTIQSIPWQNL